MQLIKALKALVLSIGGAVALFFALLSVLLWVFKPSYPSVVILLSFYYIIGSVFCFFVGREIWRKVYVKNRLEQRKKT